MRGRNSVAFVLAVLAAAIVFGATVDAKPLRPHPTKRPHPHATVRPSRTPSPTVVPTVGVPPGDCSGTLQSRIDAASTGSTLNLTGCTFSGSATISKALTLIGVTLNVPSNQTGIIIAASNVTLQGVTIVGAHATVYDSDEYGIDIRGAVTPRSNVAIRDSTVRLFGGVGINAERAPGLSITNTLVEDIVYIGIQVIATAGGLIDGNTVKRIGVVGSEANGGNAYGIALTQWTDGSTKTTDFVVSDNLVEDVPTWHGFDTHAGARIDWLRNTVRGCRDGFFITGWPIDRALDNVLDGNFVYETIGSNQYAITSVYSTDGAVTNNLINGWDSGHEILQTSGGDPDATAVNLTVSGNTIVP